MAKRTITYNRCIHCRCEVSGVHGTVCRPCSERYLQRMKDSAVLAKEEGDGC